jgi:hypothetical protein
VAHAIELDNEAEHRLPHRTTRAGDAERRDNAPWLVSSVLWSTVLQQVGGPGITVAELRTRARTNQLLLGGLRRWGYVVVTPPAGEALRNPPQDAAIVRTTAVARRAGAVWRSLPAVMERRWRSRFGGEAVDHLRRSLRPIFERLPFDPPAFLPVVAPTQNGRAEPTLSIAAAGTPAAARVSTADLSQLLSGVLLGFTVDFERESRISLPICANTLRVLRPSGVRIRDLPRLTGVSKEANAMCAGWLERHECAMAQPDPAAPAARCYASPKEGHERSRSTVACSVPRKQRGDRRTGRPPSTTCGRRSSMSSGTGPSHIHPSREDSIPTQTIGVPACGNVPTRCRTTRWCCIEVATPTAAEHPSD